MWGVLEFNFHLIILYKHAAEDGVTATVEYYAKPFPHNLPIFYPSGVKVLVVHQYITAKVSLYEYSPIFYPTDI